MPPKWDTAYLPCGTAAVAPVVVTASRATDMPAFHSQWLMQALRDGSCVSENPYNRKKTAVSFAKTEVISFWTKYPKAMLKHLQEIEQMGFGFFFNYTINDYLPENMEPKLPPLNERLQCFMELAKLLGPSKMIWRADPLLIAPGLTIGKLCRRIEAIGDALAGAASEMVFSFVQLQQYAKLRGNPAIERSGLRELNPCEINYAASFLSQMQDKWRRHTPGFCISLCSANIDLSDYGISASSCISADKLASCFHSRPALMEFLGYRRGLFGWEKIVARSMKDPGQRPLCNCVASKDIGRYDTCPFICTYCYANSRVNR
jgi:hypothetical protein